MFLSVKLKSTEMIHSDFRPNEEIIKQYYAHIVLKNALLSRIITYCQKKFIKRDTGKYEMHTTVKDANYDDMF